MALSDRKRDQSLVGWVGWFALIVVGGQSMLRWFIFRAQCAFALAFFLSHSFSPRRFKVVE